MQRAFVTKQKTPLILHQEVGGKGRGVFAGAAFAKGAEVLEFLGDVRDRDEFEDLTHALQIGPREFLSASGDVDDFVNHSCKPNCGVRETDDKRIVLFAFRPIAANEEITFDYSTTQTGGFWEMECHCGAEGCRKRIGDFKDLPRAAKDYYVKQNAVLPFLIEEA